MNTIRVLLALVLFPLALNSHAERTLDKSPGWPGNTLSGQVCFGSGQGFGPFDYTDPKKGRPNLPIVENTHFTPEVEQLIRGNTSSTPAGDLNYTLKAFPNHHRALWSMSRYYLRQLKTLGYENLLAAERQQKDPPPPECYFNRAMAFKPDDAIVPAIYGIYLHRRGKLDAALENYKKAEMRLPKRAELIYNMGLLYLDMADIEKAKEYAIRAQALNYPLKGLTNRIAREEAEKVSEQNSEQTSK